MADTDSFAASWAEAEARHEARKPANQSRVEAVRAALEWAANRGLNICDERTAQAAIDANDAWLKAQAAADIERWMAKAEHLALLAIDRDSLTPYQIHRATLLAE